MYVPSFFKVENTEEIRDFIHHNAFGIVISQTNGKLLASHIPLLLTTNSKGKDLLTGHLSRANPQWKSFESEKQVLVIFQGPHTYISSSWYDHNNVPTWNYMAAHVYGSLRFLTEEELLISLQLLTDKYEFHSANPVSVGTMDKHMLSAQLKGIVGFEIEIEEVQAAYKLSQNRDEKNHLRIIDELEKKGDENSTHIAKEMKRNRS
ncbi:MAG: transcriptional regulator [Cytophagaceae bacterium]|jgi:transcriptional regulator|nr:transcriptional regulator [Cytophagaceae bacterium]